MRIAQDSIGFLSQLGSVIAAALKVEATLLQQVADSPHAALLVAVVALLATCSLLLGQSLLLFVNRIARRRFVATLLLNGLFYLAGLVAWGGTIWFVGELLLPQNISLTQLTYIMLLSTAPLILGVLILMPYAGPAIARLLHVWSLFIVLRVLSFEYGTSLATTLLLVGGGWLLMWLLSNTAGRPLIRIRHALLMHVAGSSLTMTSGDLLERYGASDISILPEKVT